MTARARRNWLAAGVHWRVLVLASAFLALTACTGASSDDASGSPPSQSNQRSSSSISEASSTPTSETSLVSDGSPSFLGWDPSAYPETGGGPVIQPDELPEPETLDGPETFDDTMRFEPPQEEASTVSSRSAFSSGVAGGPYRATTPPDRVFLAVTTNAVPGSEEIIAGLAKRLTWVFEWQSRPYFHLRAGVHTSDFVVLVDALSGEGLLHTSVVAASD